MKDDTISRAAAIDAIENAFDRETILNRFVRKIAISAVRTLPSAQPEIIRCRNCKHWREDHTCKEHSLVSPMMAYEFCSRAERREE